MIYGLTLKTSCCAFVTQGRRKANSSTLSLQTRLLQLHIERQRGNALEVLRHNISKVPDLEIPDGLRSTSHRTAERQTVGRVCVRRDVHIQTDNATPIGNGPVLFEGADDQSEDRAGVTQRVAKIKLVWGNFDLKSGFGGIKLEAG
jgi:hypothetical protein